MERVYRPEAPAVSARGPPFSVRAVGAPVRRLLRRFGRDTAAATALEYCLIATLIGVAIIVGATALGTSLNSHYSDIAGRIPSN
jgi:pilus assembly protein Flp/PilA